MKLYTEIDPKAIKRARELLAFDLRLGVANWLEVSRQLAKEFGLAPAVAGTAISCAARVRRKEELVMTHGDYLTSIDIALRDESFYALIMAAMRRADTDNLAKLKKAWPEVWQELHKRYNADGGVLATDGSQQVTVTVEEEPW